MTVLLALAGAVSAFLIGLAVGRARALVAGDPAPAAEPVSSEVVDLLEDHPVGIVVTDAEGEVRYRNAMGRSLPATHVGVLIDAAVRRHLDTARRGEASGEVVELYGPPKTVLVVDARPIASGGAIAFVEDVSEQRRLDQVRTDFVANISHELKTPIGAMSVLAETLLDETDHDTMQRVVARMMGEAQRATRTIDDLMELSRIELGDERRLEPVAVADVVHGALGRVTELAVQRDIQISVDPVPAGLTIAGDRRQLVSAVGNLVENAVKYSEAGAAVTIQVRNDDARIEIDVVDHGVGIPQRDLDRIFERFYRVDRARSRSTGGTGLGLSIVRHVVTNHSGEVLVRSVEGEGSTFTLRLPRDRPDADPAEATASLAETLPAETLPADPVQPDPKRSEQTEGVA